MDVLYCYFQGRRHGLRLEIAGVVTIGVALVRVVTAIVAVIASFVFIVLSVSYRVAVNRLSIRCSSTCIHSEELV